MVLADLGKKIQSALASLSAEAAIDEETLDALLKDICKALLESDVNVKLVQSLRTNVKNAVNIAHAPPGTNKKRLIQRTVFDELCRLIDPQTPAPKLTKGQRNVVMFVGLQGSGKTTTCTKYAYYYARKGWKVCLICADTFRAGAFDQLKQNATKAKIPFYGSYTEADPVQIVADGLAKFTQENFELIIVDTSGRHKQEAALFDEMRQISAVARPNSIVFVMDASIGQAADAQARAFSDAVDIGAIIITKLDGHAKGGGAISGVAATHSPIIFVGTGEHIHDFEPFNVQSFLNKMLGYGDVSGIVDAVSNITQLDKDGSFARKIEQGIFTLREMQEQLNMILQMGPMSKVISMLPGLNADIFKGSDADVSRRMKRFMAILDSMTQKELDSDGKVFHAQPTRIRRVSLGSGTFPVEVAELLAQYKQFAHLVKSLGANGLLSGASMGSGSAAASNSRNSLSNERNMNKMSQQLSKFLPPDMLSQMGGAAGLSGFMKQFESAFSAGDLGADAGDGAGSSSNDSRRPSAGISKPKKMK